MFHRLFLISRTPIFILETRLSQSFNSCEKCGQSIESGSFCRACQNDATVAFNPTTDDGATLPPNSSTVGPGSGNKINPNAGTPTGKDFGDYELCDEIARGGMGIVYKARDKQLNRIVAIKMIIGGQFSSDEDVQRFRLEAEAAAKLDHSGIVPIYEIGSREGQPFFAMKYIEGGSLADHRDRFLDNPRGTAKLIEGVARAVHHAHQRGILHRDIKPANILLDENDQPVLTDLGLAKIASNESNLTQTGAVLGTPSYMSPEQARSDQSLTTAADIYSIGAILYELLVGRPPHRGSTALETVLQVIKDPIKPLREFDSSVNRDLELICMNCLHRDPESRYDTAGELADDLENWIAGKPISVRPATLLTRTAQWMRHNQGIVYAMLLMLTGVVFATPIILSVLGSLDNPAALYANTNADPRPVIYSFTNIPKWVSIAGSLMMVIVWPSLGLFVTLVTRPKSWLDAMLKGAIVGGATVLLLLVTMGWVLFSVTSQSTSNEPVRLLAEGLWPSSEIDSEAIKNQIIEKYPKLADIPDNQKVNYVSNRIFADGVAIGPRAMLLVVGIGLAWGLPIVCGTVIGFVLLRRGHRWWILGPRYALGWFMSMFSIILLTTVFGGGNFNGKTFWELEIWIQLCMVLIPSLLTWLVLRRWKRVVTPAQEN